MLEGTIKKVIDGDTIELQNEIILRLENVDAPEINELGGVAAKNKLEQLVSNKIVKYTEEARDDYSRIVSNVYIGNLWVNEEMRKYLSQ